MPSLQCTTGWERMSGKNERNFVKFASKRPKYANDTVHRLGARRKGGRTLYGSILVFKRSIRNGFAHFPPEVWDTRDSVADRSEMKVLFVDAGPDGRGESREFKQ